MEALTGLTNIDATHLRVLSGGSMTDILDLISGGGSGDGTVDSYTRSETDALLGAKLDDVVAGTNITVTGTGATKTVNCTVDTSGLAQASDVYTKSQVDGALATKVGTGTVYTKGETDTLVDGCLTDVTVGTGLTVSSGAPETLRSRRPTLPSRTLTRSKR